ncbi:MAG: HIT family protein [Thermoplasmata archaeon]|nr:HIT family protein [Thermoplasmata archaeon]
MTACTFCDLLTDPERGSGRVLYEDDLLWVAHELEEGGASYRGAVMLLLKRHTESGLAEITDEEGARMGRLVAQVSRALRAVLGVPWTYTYCFTEGFRHVHQFVIARYPGVPARYVRLGIQRWPKAPRGNRPEVERLVRALRNSMRAATGSGRRKPRSVRAANDD